MKPITAYGAADGFDLPGADGVAVPGKRDACPFLAAGKQSPSKGPLANRITSVDTVPYPWFSHGSVSSQKILP